MKAYTAYTTKAHTILIQAKQKTKKPRMFEVINPRSHNTYQNWCTRRSTYSRIWCENTPWNKRMKEEILWNKHFITIGGMSIFYKAWVSRGIQILNHLLDSHGVLFPFENFKSNRGRCSVLHICAGRLAAIPKNYILHCHGNLRWPALL